MTRYSEAAPAAEQDPPDVARRRRSWFDAQPDLDPERLIFIDGTGTSTRMARMNGLAPRGEHCRASISHGHWKITTFVAGLTIDGVVATMTIDGAMTGQAFLAYVEQVLVPVLKPGDFVILDNLPPVSRSPSASNRGRQRRSCGYEPE